jgi:hypothetical protein
LISASLLLYIFTSRLKLGSINMKKALLPSCFLLLSCVAPGRSYQNEDDVAVVAALGESVDPEIQLLQLRVTERNVHLEFTGCNISERFDFDEPPKQEVMKVLQDLPSGANPWHSSTCGRTKTILDSMQQMIVTQGWSCPEWKELPRTVLSFGCSVGIEAEEAKARFPMAEVMGYDIDASTVARARRRTNPGLNISFFSRLTELPERSFDLILVNNVLYNKMSTSDFRKFFQQLLGLLTPKGGLLELQVYDSTMLPMCGNSTWCKGMRFDASVAWEGVKELLPGVLRSPERSCQAATVPIGSDVVQASTLFLYRSGSQPWGNH